MAKIVDYKTDRECFSPMMLEFIENGTKWKDTMEMQNSMTAEEKGWLKDVFWKKTYIGDIYIGIGLHANEDIKKGEVVRKGDIGKNVIHITPTKNLPKLNRETLEYMRNYSHKFGGDECGDEALLLYVPGCSFNHATSPTLTFAFRKMGRDLVAARDVVKGEQLTIDYLTFGPKVEWWPNLLEEKTGDRTCVFKGENDYV